MSDESLRRDELLSAYLDGEATPAEIAEVEGDDALLARVEELRAMSDAVAAPVPSLSAEQRDQLITAALGVADAEVDARLEAKIVPRHRPQPLFLAVAAAVILLAAAVSAGLLGSRGGDDADMAAESTSMAGSAAPAEMADEPMAQADMAAADEAMADEEPMAEEPMADEEPMAEEPMADEEPMAEEPMADEEPMAEEPIEEAMADEEPMAEEPMAEEESMAEADMAAAEAAAMAAPAATTTVRAIEADDSEDQAAPEPTSGIAETEEERRSESTTDGGESDTDGADGQVVDLGMLENLESLFENIGAKWSAALEDEAMADPGVCSAAVADRALAMSAETRRSFVATVGAENPLTFDAQFVRRPDGSALVIYAALPDCEIEIHELAGS